MTTRYKLINLITIISIAAVLTFGAATTVMADDTPANTAADNAIGASESTDSIPAPEAKEDAAPAQVQTLTDPAPSQNNQNQEEDQDKIGNTGESEDTGSADDTPAKIDDPSLNEGTAPSKENDSTPAGNTTDPEGTPAVSKNENVSKATDRPKVGSDKPAVVPSRTAATVMTHVVNVSKNGEQKAYTTDAKGNVRIRGFLHKFDKGAFGQESFTLHVNGVAYPITVYSDGTYDGDLPEGFFIRNSSLYINGAKSDLDISVEDYSAISGIYSEPSYEVPAAHIVTLVSNDGSQKTYVADENGMVAIRDLFQKADKGAYRTDTFELFVNAASYTITVNSDGTWMGTLPEGFSIKDGILYISELIDDMEIIILDHSALSSIYVEPSIAIPARAQKAARNAAGVLMSKKLPAYNFAPAQVSKESENGVVAVSPASAQSEKLFTPKSSNKSAVLGANEAPGFPVAKVIIAAAAALLLAAAAAAVVMKTARAAA